MITKPLPDPVLIFLIGSLRTNFSEIIINLQFQYQIIKLKISSAHWWSCCLSLNVITLLLRILAVCFHDDVIKWKHFPRYWPFVRGNHRFPVISPHKGQWRGALMFSLICVWIDGWINNREAGDLRRYRAHYDVIVMRRGNIAWCANEENKSMSIVYAHLDVHVL